MDHTPNIPPSDHGDGGAGALHRKVATGRAEHQARAMSLARALRLSIAKVADEVFDMAMATLSLRMEEVAGPDLDQIFDDSALLLILDGPQRRRAAVAVDPVLVGALIQQQTMGQVQPVTDDTLRPMTTTDAAICAPFLDGIFAQIGDMPEKDAERRLVHGFRFGARAEDARLLHLAMQAPLYQIIRLSLDIEQGTRQGELTICMPVPDSAALDLLEEAGAEQAGRDDAVEAHSLGESVPNLTVPLRMVLTKLQMPLGKISSLSVGEVLPLREARFDAVDVQSLAGTRIAQAVLGQIDGMRAVQVRPRDTAQTAPQRRLSDRADLDQPELAALADLTEGDRPAEPDFDLPLPDAMPPMNDGSDGPLLDLPDMSDIPDFEDIALTDRQAG